MNISYITTGNPYDKNSWSGTNYYTRKALMDAGFSICCINNFNKRIVIKDFMLKSIYKLLGTHFDYTRTLKYSKYCAKVIERELEQATDAIFSLGTVPVANLNTKIPIYIMIDAIYIANNHKIMHKEAIKNETIALNKAKLIFVSSDVTKQSILENYQINENKINVVPLGANIDNVPTRDCLEKLIFKRLNNTIKILFVGVDWERKGAQIVLDSLNILRKRGVNIQLDLVGIPVPPVELPDYVINHGFINKNSESGASELMKLYEDAHFLFVPSISEPYGLVFCEANAYGVPVISHSVGGLLTIVKNGVNGQLFELGTKPEIFAEYIYSVIQDTNRYISLCMSSRDEFDKNLNWKAFGEKIKDIIL